MTKVIGGDFERKTECNKIGLPNCVYIFQWCRRRGGSGCKRTPKFWFVKITRDIHENPGKAGPNVVWFKKVASKVYRRTHKDLFWRS